MWYGFCYCSYLIFICYLFTKKLIVILNLCIDMNKIIFYEVNIFVIIEFNFDCTKWNVINYKIYKTCIDYTIK